MSPSASLDNLQLFIAVAEAGGFSRASERLDLPVATLSRRVAQLGRKRLRALAKIENDVRR